jgi:hypothetical protein
VDFFELADANRDGMIDYSEFMSLFDEDGKPHSRQFGKDSLLGEDAYTEEEEEDGEGGQKARIRANRYSFYSLYWYKSTNTDVLLRSYRSKEPLLKVEPFGADELRAIMVQRRRREIERQRKELARRAAQQAGTQFTCFTGTNVQTLTLRAPQTWTSSCSARSCRPRRAERVLSCSLYPSSLVQKYKY